MNDYIPPVIDIRFSAILGYIGEFGRSSSNPVSISSIVEFNESFPQALDKDRRNVSAYFINGGETLVCVNLFSVYPLDITSGLSDLINLVDHIDFLLVSDALLVGNDALISAVQRIAHRRNAVFLLDPPGDTPTQVLKWKSDSLDSNLKHVAMYYPPLMSEDGRVTASIVAAAVFNRLDQSIGVWANPSGATTQINAGYLPSQRLSNEETLTLNMAGVNCVRTFKSIGTVLWGSVTGVGLQHPNPYWKYIQMRRFYYYLKRRISSALIGIPLTNGDQAAVQMGISIVEPFLLELFAMNGLVGDTVHESYTIDGYFDPKCGVVLTVGVAILQPNEWIDIVASSTGSLPT